jgi:hypothetical protein
MRMKMKPRYNIFSKPPKYPVARRTTPIKRRMASMIECEGAFTGSIDP